MNLTVLGTGHALVTGYYQSCFVLSENDRSFLLDGGGGSGILKQLKDSGIDWKNIKDIFVTHKHIDHVMGIIWMIRMICHHMNHDDYEGDVKIYSYGELLKDIEFISRALMQDRETRFIGDRIHMVPVEDRQEMVIMGRRAVFFDTNSAKTKQFGCVIYLNEEEKLTFCGDEPFYEGAAELAAGSKWMLHEALCLESEADIYHPHEIHHSTVMEACETAQKLGVKNLVLYHTEDDHTENRKALYGEEGRKYFRGNLYIPEDLESFEL